MNNKILVKLIVPEIDSSFDIFLPVNELIWKVKKLIVKSISDLTGGILPIEREYVLINKETGKIYDSNQIIIDTDIRNITELVLISKTI